MESYVYAHVESFENYKLEEENYYLQFHLLETINVNILIHTLSDSPFLWKWGTVYILPGDVLFSHLISWIFVRNVFLQ